MQHTGDDSSTGELRIARRELRLFAGTSSGPRVRVVSSVRLFRELARQETGQSDRVLEIGCSTGETTRVLAQRGATVVAVDTSKELSAKTAESMRAWPNVTVHRADARNMPTLLKLMPEPDVVCIDVGGSAQLNTVSFVLRQCLKTCTPRLLLIRNTELAALACLIEAVEVPLPERWPFEPVRSDDETIIRLENLLAISRSEQADSRVFAARRLRLYDEPRAHKRLSELTSDSHPRVRRVALAILDDIARQKQ